MAKPKITKPSKPYYDPHPDAPRPLPVIKETPIETVKLPPKGR